jgi:hypothetical protein
MLLYQNNSKQHCLKFYLFLLYVLFIITPKNQGQLTCRLQYNYKIWSKFGQNLSQFLPELSTPINTDSTPIQHELNINSPDLPEIQPK